MGRIFDLDSPFMRFLNLVGDLMILNFLMIICCIPIITIGASCTGMYYVLLKIVRGEEGYLVKGFFKSFKQNFKQATILWLIMLLVIAVYVGDFMIFRYSGMTFPTVLIVAILAIALVLIMVSVYVFPVLSRFDNTVKNILKNAFCMAVLNLPKTLLLIIIQLIPLIVLYFSSYAAIFVFMFGISLPAYCSAHLFSGIFKKYEPEAEAVVSDYEFSVQTEEGNEENNG
ncbi:MAG: DUF624 domain-containing protein [Bacillus sp. (in: Bacteria)]|nr:DUF624 domain-containing protein [Bacillus sp. (in: firmicutes)]MCM1427471.1 DUF624 domain-containing protein [Eubacterium sp.]